MQARALLRSRRRGRDHPARADRRQDGASVSGAPARRRAGDLRASAARAGAQAHARRAAVSGAAAADGDGRRGIHRRRSGGAAARDGLQAIGEADAADRDAAARGHGDERHHRRGRGSRSCCRSRRSRCTDFPNRTPPASRCSSMRARISRRTFPAAFYTALLNNQPMGFYSPGDAREGRAAARRPLRADRRADLALDLLRAGRRQRSGWGCGTCRGCAMRRGQSGSQSQAHGRAAGRGFRSLDDLVARAGLRQDELRTLAEIGALASFGGDRRTALWQAERAGRPAGPLADGRTTGRQATEPRRGRPSADAAPADVACSTASAPTTTARA